MPKKNHPTPARVAKAISRAFDEVYTGEHAAKHREEFYGLLDAAAKSLYIREQEDGEQTPQQANDFAILMTLRDTLEDLV